MKIKTHSYLCDSNSSNRNVVISGKYIVIFHMKLDKLVHLKYVLEYIFTYI